MSELKPCPFCGGEAELTGFDAPEFWVWCPNCKASTDAHTCKGGAIEAWNSRAERTCEMETDHDELEVIAYSHEDTWAYKCSACDWSFRYDRGIKPNYCPNCGAKVVDA